MSGSEEVMSFSDSELNELNEFVDWGSLNEMEDVGIVQIYANEPWAHSSNEDEDYEGDQRSRIPVALQVWFEGEVTVI